MLPAFLFWHTPSASAQQAEPTSYIMYSYMKIMPGKWDDYLKLEKAFKKIHAARKAAGNVSSWGLLQVLSPSGANAEYQFVTYNAFAGEAQLANSFEGQFMPENWTKLLTPDEIELVMNAREIRSIVKREVWRSADSVLADDHGSAKISVFNYFDFPEGGSREKHTKVETDIWKPIHAARVKDGSLKGWRLLQMEMPFGAGMPYHDATIDLYADMTQYLSAQWDDKIFAKVHPGKDMNAMFKLTDESCTLLKGEVRMVIDRLEW